MGRIGCETPVLMGAYCFQAERASARSPLNSNAHECHRCEVEKRTDKNKMRNVQMYTPFVMMMNAIVWRKRQPLLLLVDRKWCECVNFKLMKKKWL